MMVQRPSLVRLAAVRKSEARFSGAAGGPQWHLRCGSGQLDLPLAIINPRQIRDLAIMAAYL
jgi:hypothetical protein